MRTHNHQEIKENCRSVIMNLMNKHKLGRVSFVTMDTEGWVNPCFFVNDEYVIRFNARDPGLPKYQREKFVFDLLKDLKFPVPDRVILDTDKDIIDYDILISRKVSGDNLESCWSKLDRETQISLAEEAGALLKKLHSIKFDYFGELANRGPLPQTKFWFDFLEAKLEFLLSEARKLELFSPTQEKQFVSKLHSRSELINTVKKASLVHVDYHFGNLLFDEKKITGVVDFEWSIAGDPLYDLMFWRNANDVFKGSEERFFKGYGKVDFNTEESLLISTYQMIKNIELSIVATLHFPKEEARDYLDITLKDLSN